MASTGVLHVVGDLLLQPGAEAQQHCEMWVLEGRATFTAPTTTGLDVQTVTGYLLPGLVDAHCHVGLAAHGAVDDATSEDQALTDRAAGTLLIRDAGSPADTRWVDDRGDLPRLVRAGRHIARTKRYIRNFAHEVEPDQVVQLVRQEAKRGDGWVKLVGDWIDREGGDLAPSFPRETVMAAVQAAHEEGARTTAHCFGEESLRDFAAAGTDCIEHATGLQPDTIEAFGSRSIAIVPTLVNIASFPHLAEPAREKFPGYYAHMLDLHARRYETIAAAHDAGIPIYLGTDAGGSLPHGLIADEAAELERAGLSRDEVLTAATWGARQWLRQPGLAEGDSADFVVYQDDPRQDLSALKRPSTIVLRGVVR